MAVRGLSVPVSALLGCGSRGWDEQTLPVSGQMVRSRVHEIRQTRRNTQGVKLQAIAPVIADEDERDDPQSELVLDNVSPQYSDSIQRNR